jgi:hypothetical protein
MRAYDERVAYRREHGEPNPLTRLGRDNPPPRERLTFGYGDRDFLLTDVTEQVVRGIPTSASR